MLPITSGPLHCVLPAGLPGPDTGLRSGSDSWSAGKSTHALFIPSHVVLCAISQSVRVGLSVGLALLMLATMLALAFTACRDPGVIPKQLPEQLEVTRQ